MAEKVNKKAAQRHQGIEDRRKQLLSSKASERREAAYWLGEAAADGAVEDLIHVYQTDRDGSVRAAAAYALGQFKAIDDALARGQQAKVEKLLHQVEQDGKVGSRGARGRWARIALGLLIALIVFVALSWIVYGGPGGLSAALQSVFAFAAPASTVQPTPDVAELSVIANDLQAAYAPIKADLTTLQQQFTSVLGGNAANCGAAFNRPAPYALPADAASRYPQLGDLGARLNEMQSSFAQAVAAFDAACAGGEPLTAATVGTAYAALRPALEAMPQMDAALLALGQQLTPSPTPLVTETPVATATRVPPTATPGPTAVPTTEIQLTDPRRYIVAALSLTDRLLGPTGPATTLNSAWAAAAATASPPAACNVAAPELPDNIELPQDARDAAPDLAIAVDEVNSALELLQSGWTNFVFACGARSANVSAAQGQADIANVIARLTLVQERLNVLAGL